VVMGLSLQDQHSHDDGTTKCDIHLPKAPQTGTNIDSHFKPQAPKSGQVVDFHQFHESDVESFL